MFVPSTGFNQNKKSILSIALASYSSSINDCCYYYLFAVRISTKTREIEREKNGILRRLFWHIIVGNLYYYYYMRIASLFLACAWISLFQNAIYLFHVLYSVAYMRFNARALWRLNWETIFACLTCEVNAIQPHIMSMYVAII